MKSEKPFPSTLRVGILVFEGFEPIDVWGFVEPFTIARFIGTNYFAPPPYPFEVLLISNETRPAGTDTTVQLNPVRSVNGPQVMPDMARDDALKEKFDVIMIPGGAGVYQLLDPSDPKRVAQLLGWVRAMANQDDQRLMTSVCTGAAVLAASGLLNGKPATTNHAAFGWVTSFGPLVLWNNVSRWVDAGRFVTSAGVSAGTDMGFYLVSRLCGRAVAEQAALSAEYAWHRDPEQPIHYPQQAKVPN